jgi:aminopeptidase-like protein
MSFEKTVLVEVAKIVADKKASFTNGTLFVECSIAEAVKIETALLKNVKCGIILSRVGDESAYDFV